MSMDKACITAIEEVCKRCNLYTKLCGMLECPSQCVHSGHFIDGYHQAEKDLELTWEDIDTIYNLLCEEFNYQLECGKRPQKEACQEVLKRFKRTKEL